MLFASVQDTANVFPCLDRMQSKLERRQRRQIDACVFLVDGRERAVLGIEEYPGIDPLPELEVTRPNDRTVEGRRHQELVLEMLGRVRVGDGLFGERGHGGCVNLT